MGIAKGNELASLVTCDAFSAFRVLMWLQVFFAYGYSFLRFRGGESDQVSRAIPGEGTSDDADNNTSLPTLGTMPRECRHSLRWVSPLCQNRTHELHDQCGSMGEAKFLQMPILRRSSGELGQSSFRDQGAR